MITVDFIAGFYIQIFPETERFIYFLDNPIDHLNKEINITYTSCVCNNISYVYCQLQCSYFGRSSFLLYFKHNSNKTDVPAVFISVYNKLLTVCKKYFECLLIAHSFVYGGEGSYFIR